MARTDPQLNLRIPIELKEQIEESAKNSGRSTTAEIINAIDFYLKRQMVFQSEITIPLSEQLLKLAGKAKELECR